MAMLSDDRLLGLLERWEAERHAGRVLSVAELCRDCPELLPEAQRRIAVLRQFHLLSLPPADASVESQDRAESSTVHPQSPALPGTLPAPGTRFGRYQILAELGRGGMGVVYRARDAQLDREVALKVVRPDRRGTTDRFLREARAMAAVRHDHVVEVYDYGEEGGVRFVAMPLLAGETLAARLERQAPLPAAELIRVGRELAEGLAAVHQKGLIHRDLKPANVWLEAPRGRVKLLDFGLARDPRAEDGLTSPGAVVGTPEFMSPEQVNGHDLGAQSDLFSLGSVLYEAATGQAAFAAPTRIATFLAIGEKTPPPAGAVNPDVPAGLSDLIERLHRKRPEDRPASAAEVARELGRLAADPPAPTVIRPAGRRRPGRSRRARVAVAGALGLLLIVGAILYHPWRDRLGETGPARDSAAAPTPPPEPVRVRALEILHLGARDRARKRFGFLPPGIEQESFGATGEDDIKVTARLSRPAPCYLIVFRPDGVDEVLYPQGADLTPEQTEEPHYPSKDRGKVYGLTDGTGLWLVALVASDQPLPAYAEWRRQHPGGPWAKSDGEAGVVWLDDGSWLEAVTARGVQNRGTRGEKQAAGTSPVVRVVDWLKAETGGTVSAVGFTVEAKR
jgi:serine/threonine protein kinase